MIPPNLKRFRATRMLVLVGMVCIGLVVSTVPPPLAQSSGAFTTTGTLNAARVFHTATLLNNGQVLVAGGGNAAGQVFASTEVYNPTTGKWTVAANMKTARYFHTATMLPNGEVLVAGGVVSVSSVTGAVSCTATAERYDSSTGRWTSTGSMTKARFEQAATLLDDGQVLVAGGFDANGSELTSAEVYDPSTGTWQATASMNVARAGTQAALLQNGQVLIPGGNNSSSGENTAELYSNGHWTLTGAMKFAHTSAHVAPLTNGDVLIFGGHLASYASEFFDASTGAWTATHNIGVNPPNGPLTLLDTGEVLLAGGESGYGTDSLCRLFNSSTNSWLVTGSMNHARTGHTVTLLPNGQVLVAGGKFKNSNRTFSVLGSAEIYTP